MKLGRLPKPVVLTVALAALGAAGYATRDNWMALVRAPGDAAPLESEGEPVAPTGKIIVNEQAQLNLGLSAKPIKPEVYWKIIQVPGMVVDRPGLSDRGVVAPATGTVSKVHHFPGDTLRPGETLFTFKLLSETLHQTQTELFKATQNIKLAETERKRLAGLGDAVAGTRVIEKDNEIVRLKVLVKAYRQELLNRGFGPELVDGVTDGRFVNEITITVPAVPVDPSAPSPARPSVFEMQELKIEPGQQVQAGQTLCLLADHQALAVEGRAFRDEAPLLEKSVKERWPVEVDFQEDAPADWGPIKQTFRIRYLANTIDPTNRTFAFRVPLENESRVIEDEGRTQTLWRFRPGQKVRLLVRVERIDNVFVLPADAVTREGGEAFVFTQNVNTFTRKPVRVLLQDRQQVVLANDGSLVPGIFVVQGGAAQLNRMVKSGGTSGVPKGYHVHADGSLHKNEDEGK